jgi:hypothetical protein
MGRATGTLGTVKEGEEGLGREEEVVGTEEVEAEEEAIQVIEEEISHVIVIRTGSKRTIRRTNC